MNSPTLREYIEKVGDEKAAKVFGVSRRTAKSWRLGDRTPRPGHVSKIIKKSPVTYDGILRSRKSA